MKAPLGPPELDHSGSRAFRQDAGRSRVACFLQLLAQHLVAERASHLLVLLTMAVGALGMAATFFIGDGALNELWKDMETLMGSQITLQPDPGPNGALLKRRSAVSFQETDLTYLRSHVPSAKYIVPHLFRRAQVGRAGIELAMVVEGASPELCRESAFAPVRGRSFSEAAQAGHLFECLVTESVVDRLRLSVGERISVGDRLFEMVGVVPDPPTADARSQIRVVIPLTTAQLIYGQPGVYEALVTAWRQPDEMERLLVEIKCALDTCLGPGCYYVSSTQIALRRRQTIVSNIMAFGAAQAMFCVLVASIGVANVMLATVLRRSREYAIRISMGARQAEIFGLVLSESMLIGLVGGLIGILLAVMVSPVVCHGLARHIREATNLSPVFCLRGVLIPLAACGASSLLAGIFPALQIRRLDVLSVLRAE
jgi:hypothetical protein